MAKSKKSTAQPEKPESVSIRVVRVKEIYFSINELLFIDGKMAKVELNQIFGFNLEKELVNLELNASLSYEDALAGEKLVEMTVQNFFHVEGLQRFVVAEEDITLPQNIYITIVGICISHVRALMAQRTSGTALQDTLLPIMSPVEVAKAFFPTKFIKQD